MAHWQRITWILMGVTVASVLFIHVGLDKANIFPYTTALASSSLSYAITDDISGLESTKPTTVIFDAMDTTNTSKQTVSIDSGNTYNSTDQRHSDKPVHKRGRLHVRQVTFLERVFPKRNDSYHMEGINCARVMDGGAGTGLNRHAINYSLSLDISDKVYRIVTKNCMAFIRRRGYIMMPANQEEADFPIAFSILVHRNVFVGERLLRAIYRPQNYYCIHVDKKSHPELRRSWEAIVRCLPNVFLTNTSYNVVWGELSVILPEIQCMRELLAYKWKYFINLTGLEFPLKTNWELVQILRTYNGSNDVDTFHEWTIEGKHNYRFDFKLPAPHGIRPLKGYAHGTFSRAFVEYVVHSPVARDFLEWLNGTLIPDETFFGSLQHGNPHLKVPGSFIGDDDMIIAKPSMTRFKIFMGQPAGRQECPGGFWLRRICQLGVRLLPQLKHTPKLFLNKVHPTFQPAALNCLEELIYNRTVGDYKGERRINTTFYENLPFVKSHV